MAALSSQSSLQMLSGAPDIAPDDILLVSCVRNERLRLPWFIDYHRRLGVDHFLIVDNASTDGTLEYLQGCDNVTVFFTEENFGASVGGTTWSNDLLNAYAAGHWALIADVDELLVYPNCETHGLPVFVQYLDFVGAEALETHMLDMYAMGPINDVAYHAGEPFLSACPFFDGGSYRFAVSKSHGGRLVLRGGPRQRLFWQGRDTDSAPPSLYKIPLVKWRAGLALEAATHILRGVRLPKTNGILLHFKFLQDFPSRAEQEVRRKEMWAGGIEYAVYADVFASDPELSAHYEGSVAYENSLQLVDLGFMDFPPGYLNRDPPPSPGIAADGRSALKAIYKSARLSILGNVRI